MPSMPGQGTSLHGSAANTPANWPPAMPGQGYAEPHRGGPNTLPPQLAHQQAPQSAQLSPQQLSQQLAAQQLAAQQLAAQQLAAQQHAQHLAQQLAQQQAAAQQGWAPQPPQPFPPQPAPRMPDPVTRSPQASTQQPAPQPTYVPQPRQPDPAGYDLGNYGVTQAMPNARQQPMAQPGGVPQWQADPPPAFQAPQPPAGFSQSQLGHQSQPGHPPQFGHPQMAPQLAPQLAPQPGQLSHAPQRSAQNAPLGQQPDRESAEEHDYEDEPPRRKRRWLVAVALVGSIAAGGGMAFAYKHMFGPKPGDRGQIVRAQPGAVKSAPADRGGKQMANTGSAALNNRLPSEGSNSAAGGDASGTTNSSGVRIVSTVPVDSPRASSGSGVPGMQIVTNPGGFPSPGQISGGPPAIQPPPQGPQRQAAVPVQQVAPTVRQPSARTQPADPVEAAPAPPPPRRAPVVKEAAATPAPPAADRPKPTGHVAVLGYRRTQLDAMKAMADVQQRYDALRDKKLEIIQSDETARGLGMIYRIVVGPRGSVGTARELCNQLKQAGMSEGSCYTMAQ